MTRLHSVIVGALFLTLIAEATSTSIHSPESSVSSNNSPHRPPSASPNNSSNLQTNNNDANIIQVIDNGDGLIGQVRQQLIQQFAFDMAKIQSLPLTKLTTPCHLISFDRSNTMAWTLAHWDEHCVSPLQRYAKHVLSWPFSTTAYRIIPMVLLVLSWSAAILLAKHSSPVIANLIAQSSLSYGLIGPSLSPIAILLSLRANQALIRLNEVRRAWGVMGKSIRSLTGVIATYGVFAVNHEANNDTDENDGKTSAAVSSMEASILVAKYLAIFAWCMKATFRKDEDDTTIIQTVLPPSEAAWLLSSGVKRPIAILTRVRSLIQQLSSNPSNNISPMMHLTLEQRLYDLEASFGICTRILLSPIPPTYTRHTSRVLCLFLFLLPLNFAGSKMSSSALLLSVMMITYVLVGIDEIGLEIAHPFPLLPMQAMASTYQKNVENQFMLLASMNGNAIAGGN